MGMRTKHCKLCYVDAIINIPSIPICSKNKIHLSGIKLYFNNRVQCVNIDEDKRPHSALNGTSTLRLVDVKPTKENV